MKEIIAGQLEQTSEQIPEETLKLSEDKLRPLAQQSDTKQEKDKAKTKDAENTDSLEITKAEAEREAIIDFDSLAKQDSDDEKQAIIEFESLVEQQADVDKQAIIEFESLIRQEADSVPKIRDEPIEAEGAPKSKDTEETAKLAVLQFVANKTISKSKKVDCEILDDLKAENVKTEIEAKLQDEKNLTFETEETEKFEALQSVAEQTLSKSKKVDPEILDGDTQSSSATDEEEEDPNLEAIRAELANITSMVRK